MNNTLVASLLIAVLMSLSACQTANAPAKQSPREQLGTIALGSCLRQWSPQPVWQGVLATSPDAFLFLGDNVYTDVGPYRQQPQPQRIDQAYRDLAMNQSFQQFRAALAAAGTDVLATWDDHDYGVNDGGADFPYQQASRRAFAAFFDLDASDIGHRPAGAAARGIYYSRIKTIADLQVQFLMLDTRSFRTALRRGEAQQCPPTGLLANRDTGATILGEAQWRWLAEALRQPADVRIIASSIQVLATEHCFEKWANFPLERQRLLDLIADTGAHGVVLVSGDRHLAEISRLDRGLPYPLYELTTSGLNSAQPSTSPAADEVNSLRLEGGNVLQDNFGTIQLAQRAGEFILRLQIRDVTGALVQEQEVLLRDLQP